MSFTVSAKLWSGSFSLLSTRIFLQESTDCAVLTKSSRADPLNNERYSSNTSTTSKNCFPAYLKCLLVDMIYLWLQQVCLFFLHTDLTFNYESTGLISLSTSIPKAKSKSALQTGSIATNYKWLPFPTPLSKPLPVWGSYPLGLSCYFIIEENTNPLLSIYFKILFPSFSDEDSEGLSST